ncbi:MAG: DNA polymerase III subunit delta [Lentisphaerae bacterium]|jgi:DNA polymerase III subunit delta|nr:DNA polymerase III subunit delta [Lentisphaerota bacterium]MBT4819595.1 DNA polymerase III subunit delta [Lentisphaerota bacterium]MBT5610793.1 DNA polymerase III subunit delta [Lentisphaerota bacterium]MBT7053775.1 DNA polymerase III subunit delta [Lentisphaerota bacterium]MBT7841236.1 DNA polymerase III subunit delta [Lentisphaerota bacterium]
MADDQTNVFLITGTDEATIATKAQDLVRKVAGEDADPFSLDVIREQDDTSAAETVNQAIRSALSPSFLGGVKTVWLQAFSKFSAEGTKDSKGAEATALRALSSLIAEGIPSDICLVVSGPDVDQRKALARACKKAGEIVVCEKPNLRDRNWQKRMQELIAQRAEEKGMSLPPKVCDYLVDVVGTDTARVDAELEKLICYCGGVAEPVTLEAAQEVCQGDGEVVGWALTNALGGRDLDDVLGTVDRLVRQGQDVERTARGLLGQAAKYFRQLLQIRVFMQECSLRDARQVQRSLEQLPGEEKSAWQDKGMEFLEFHPFRVQMMAQQALKYSGRELIAALRVFRDAFLKTVTSSAATRVVLEEALVRVVHSPRSRARRPRR